MREALFIKKNKDRWARIEQASDSAPDDMAADFIQLVDDLSYSKTFYPHSKTTRLLNVAASRIYLGIYRNRKEDGNRLWRFISRDLPATVRRHHLVFLFSFLLFSVFFVVGMLMAHKDEQFIRGMFGDEYVNLTLDNIEKGNPFGVYQGGNEFLMWLGILKNNVGVSFMMVAGGIAAGLWPLFHLVFEGVRLGAFEMLFASKGLGRDFFLTVFIHGTLEISALIISGAAGLVLGMSFIFPGTYTRTESLRKGAMDAAKIVVGLVPVFAVAAFFEGFVTRHATMAVWAKLLILGGSLAFVIGYFVVYPILIGRREKEDIGA